MIKSNRLIWLPLTTLIIYVAMLFTTIAHASAIDNVRVWPSPERTRVVFDVAAEPTFTYFTLYQTGPKRIVIDFQNTKNNADLSDVKTESLLLERVRTSTAPDSHSVRIVLEVTAAIEPTIFKLGPSGPYGHRL